MKYQAFLYDLNGTMVDDMPYHVQAWHRILNDLGADISMDRTKHECYGKNHELLERIFPGRFSLDEKTKMSLAKEEQYQREFRPNLALIPGLETFLQRSQQAGIRMGIGSAAIMFNIDFVLDELNIRHYFDAIVSADNVAESKPNPETWLSGASQLGTDPAKCLVFEDSLKGVESALNAGMDCIVITTMHQKEEFDPYPNIVTFIDDFHHPSLGRLL